MKKFALTILALALVGASAYVLFLRAPAPVVVPEVKVAAPQIRVLGKSVQGRKIEAYDFGVGSTTHLAFVGGMHGGYEWNSVLLAYEFIDYFTAHPELIPIDMKVTVIPDANPDGVYEVVGKESRFAIADAPIDDAATEPGRFNAHKVDLNRNFDCKWEPEGTWRSKKVSAGTAAFSEPESRIIRDFALAEKPDAVVFWHSQANAVYASECKDGPVPETLAIMKAYADAAGYKAVKSFDAYEVHGDAEGWLASIKIPAITVELSTHKTIEWEKNLSGVTALIRHYEQMHFLQPR